MLISSVRRNALIFLYIRFDHLNKTNKHQSPYRVVPIFLTVFPLCTLCPSDLFILYVGVCIYLSPWPFVAVPPVPVPSGHHLFVLCVYDFVSLLFVWFFRFNI